jgi:RNA polymerase sigma factor (sigma-70 family)
LETAERRAVEADDRPRESRRRGAAGDGPASHARSLIECFGAQMLATARRYSVTDEDADDAYQRAAEIAVRNRPTGTPEELRRWLRTTTKHEALAIRRQRQRLVATGAPEALPASTLSPMTTADTHDRAERLERLRHGSEALGQLKPQEIRALQLKAEGYSYKEIQAITGWTYTKVDRCLKEGRQAFLRHLSQIESGAECRRLAPHLSALAAHDPVEEIEALRSHLATCLACRARLREHRATTTRLSAAVPTAATGTSSPLDSLVAAIHDRWTALTGATHDRLLAASDRLHQATDLIAGQKAAAITASAAALASGGAMTADHLTERIDHAPPALTQPQHTPIEAPVPVTPAPQEDVSAPTATSEPPPDDPMPLPSTASEFGPESSPTHETPPESAQPPPSQPPPAPPTPAPPSQRAAPAPGQFEQ